MHFFQILSLFTFESSSLYCSPDFVSHPLSNPLSHSSTGIRSAEQTKRTVQQANQRERDAKHSGREIVHWQISRPDQFKFVVLRGDHQQHHLGNTI